MHEVNFVRTFNSSVFEGMPIPYPKREFISDDDNEDKSDNNKVRKVSVSPFLLSFI